MSYFKTRFCVLSTSVSGAGTGGGGGVVGRMDHQIGYYNPPLLTIGQTVFETIKLVIITNHFWHSLG